MPELKKGKPVEGCVISTYFYLQNKDQFEADRDVQTIRAYARQRKGDLEVTQEGLEYYAYVYWREKYPSFILHLDPDDPLEGTGPNVAYVFQRHIKPGSVCQICSSGHVRNPLQFGGGVVAWISATSVVEHDVTTGDEFLTEDDMVRSLTKLSNELQVFLDGIRNKQ